MSVSRRLFGALGAALALAALSPVSLAQAEPLKEIRIDWASYNPVSLVLKEQRFLEDEFARDGTSIRWVQSAGSNKALEFLNGGAIDFGSSAGAAALLARINGNPVKSVYVYSRPEWTALLTRPDAGVSRVEDLKGKRVAVTRGTDPHIFLVRALQKVGLGEKDVSLVLLQHADGRAALARGDVAAWGGLDPLMAAAEIEDGAKIFFRDKAANTWGVLNVREAFAKERPEETRRVLRAYEKARAWALANPAQTRAYLVAATKLPDAVIARQLDERTDLTFSSIGAEQAEGITQAGLALQQAGVIKPDVDVKATVGALIDGSYLPPAK